MFVRHSKVTLTIVVSIILLVATTMVGSAAPTNVSILTTSGEVTPNVVTACPNGNGIHDMVSRGVGDIYDTTKQQTVLFHGACYQCTKCHQVLISKWDPYFTNEWGMYTEVAGYEPVAYLTIARVPSTAIKNKTSTTPMPGYKFR